MNRIILAVLLFIGSTQAWGQDSTRVLPEATVTAFEQHRSQMAVGASIKVISVANADRYNKTSLVNGFNAVAGVRMEERSPGSYRLNIRGSSLRSPFGVRNVKVYWNNIPITDPGGNTYFNQFSYNNFSSIEIFKGPASSMYGAGTGGLLLMHNLGGSWKPGVEAEYITGSYGLQNIFATVNWGKDATKNTISYAHNQSDGYRDHTRMRRDNVNWSSNIAISEKQKIEAHVLFTDMYYQTPGGLTLTEFNNNPKQARPAAGGFPSAQTAKAAIYQKNFLAGITHHYSFTETIRNTTTVYGALAQIQNPTFRNYERRTEPSFGGRSSFSYVKDWNKNKFQLVAGGELQQGFFNTQVSKNKNGYPDTLQTDDDINYTTYSLFGQAELALESDWIFTAGASINKSTVAITRLNKYPVVKQSRSYENEISPRLSILKRFGKDFSVFGSISQGFSPPSISELLPSTGVISTFLEAEEGTNYELGSRVNFFNGKLQVELIGFYFKLDNALVVRKDSSNADYYVNAGDTRQKGIELSIDYAIRFSNSSLFDRLIIRTAQSFNDFTYGDFKKDATDFSGKHLPSVPNYTGSILADLQINPGIYLNTTYYHASSIFLNDANTVEAAAYDVIGARIGWRFLVNNVRLNIYTGGDNLLDEVYSLGNDINAAGGRYYNVAPAKNWYVGVAVQFVNSKENKKVSGE